METMKPTLDKEILDYIDNCLNLEHPESYLIAILHKIQGKYGFLSQEHMDEVAHLLQVPTSNVSGVATFYHFFRLVPKGRFSISVCLGTACFVKGAELVLDAFKNELGINMGETTSDSMFSIEGTRCIGVCALAPVVTINEEVFSNVKPNQVPEIINKIKAKSKTA
ncbi:MAG: NADH-quinone oxidoreductase subunit NuoE [Candidatus Kapaibacterium sp.]